MTLTPKRKRSDHKEYTQMKYESSITYHSKVMANVSVFCRQTGRQTNNRARTICPPCIDYIKTFWYPITRRQILDSSKLKEFADDNFKFDENGRKLS